jgi:hypothetical protein
MYTVEYQVDWSEINWKGGGQEGNCVLLNSDFLLRYLTQVLTHCTISTFL